MDIILKGMDEKNEIINFEFKRTHSLDKRKKEAERILKKYPERIPVIVEGDKSDKNAPTIDKRKYLVPKDLTMGQFVYVIRKRINLNPEQALFVFKVDKAGNYKLPSTSALMHLLYKETMHIDGFMYLKYGREKTFGS
jgi:GABA(A) receptor-associated protein